MNTNEKVYALSAEAREEIYQNYVFKKLKEAEEWAANPNARWLSEEEVFQRAERDFGV